jgi:DNA-binding transcriptional LysR family regulator
MYDWGDLRFFLAVARAGSTTAAAQSLGVSQTTVARRIAALEGDVGAQFFERHQSGYRLTELGESVRGNAERIEAEAQAIADAIAQQHRHLAGVIRVTTNESMANTFVTPWLAEFAEIYPDIRIQMIVDDRRLDLARGEADVALRAGSLPTDGALVVKKLCVVPWNIYCSQAYAARRGRPLNIEDLNEHSIIGGEGAFANLPSMRWLRDKAPRAKVVALSNNMSNLIATLKAGLGVTGLPCVDAEAEPTLLRCFEDLPELDSELFLLTRAEMKDLPRVRAFTDFISAKIASARDRLAAR